VLDRQALLHLYRRLPAVADSVRDASPPDPRALLRFLRRYGWVPRSVARRDAEARRGHLVSLLGGAVGRPEEEVSAALLAHAETVCLPEPRCEACTVADECAAYGRRPGIRELPAGARPRERLQADGPEALSETDLLALVLGGGAAGRSSLDLAQGILARFRNLRRLGTRTPTEMTSVPGVGPAKAAAVLAALELGRRLSSETLEPGGRFSCSRDLFEHFGPRMRDVPREMFLTLLLDGRNRVLREVRISEGSLTASLVHPREVFNHAIRESAVSVAFVHNHPSGDPSPSRQDVEITHRLVRTGEVIGIRVLDHVILGDHSFFSFADHGMLDPPSGGGLGA